MARLTKCAVDNLSPLPHRDVFAWDAETRGFGVLVVNSIDRFSTIPVAAAL
jgi:hypothetical protein